MATASQMLGPTAFFSRASSGIQLNIEDSDLQDPNLGGLDGSTLDGPSGGITPGVSDEQLLGAILRMLHIRTNPQEFRDNPDNRVISISVFSGRGQVGFENPQVFDTYDFTIQVRQPSASGDLPDPDSM